MNPYTRQEPYRTTHHGRGLCGGCRDHVRVHGDLVDYPRITRSRDDVLDAYAILKTKGHTKREIAHELDMTYPAFERAILRARKAGDPRAARQIEVLVEGRWRLQPRNAVAA